MPFVFVRLGRLVAHRPWLTIALWALFAALGYGSALVGIAGDNLFDRVTTGAPEVQGSDSQIGAELLADSSDAGPTINLALQHLDPTSTQVADEIVTIRDDLSKIDGVEAVVDPLLLSGGAQNPVAAALTARNNDGFLIVVQLESGLDEDAETAATTAVIAALEDVPNRLSPIAPHVTGVIGSADLIITEVTDQVQADLKTGEVIALPIALTVMVLVFGGFLAASLPIVGAIAAIAGGFLTLLLLTFALDVDAAAINVVTVLGLGLSIDYGLLIVSRFREEYARATSTGGRMSRSQRRHSSDVLVVAIENTVATAGRTVAFSAITVAISISGLIVFTPAILKAVGAAAVGVVLIGMATALTLVPALLRISGRALAHGSWLTILPGMRWVLRHTSDVSRDEGWFSALAARVQKRPLLWMGAVIGLLVVLAIPVSHLSLRSSGVELLPQDASQRAYLELLADQYPATTEAEVTVVAQTAPDNLDKWAQAIQEIPNVLSVSESTVMNSVVVLGVYVDTDDPGGDTATTVVEEVRKLDAGFPVYVTGQAALQIDFVDAIIDGLPWAVGIVALATWLLLFLMTGSVVIGIKALITNALSLGAAIGILVWAFQDEYLEGLLSFTSPGGIETYVVAMSIAFAFGLAMDYEVFLLARMFELHRQGVDDATAVRIGLQRSARIITSAAAIIIVVFAGFVAGELLIIKELGFTLAVAILIDATLVRMILVPATMTLLGRWNWWAPKFLKPVHAKFGLTH